MGKKGTGFAEGTYAVLDTETTHASPSYGRIIEVAVIRIENGSEVRRFHTLLNPERPIQPTVEAVTGISADALGNAPLFSEIEEELLDVLQGAVLVAHNAKFDYAFLRHEFARAGRRFTARCLDTVSFSKRLFPEHLHHDLSSLIVRHGLSCTHRHRAADDADVVVQFLRHAQDVCGPDRFSEALAFVLSGSTPPSLSRDVVRGLPETPGVYVFYGSSGEVLYVGKSTNIRKRVQSHFGQAGADSRELTLFQQTHRVESYSTTGELGALLLELKLIRQLRPVYNRASRSHRDLVIVKRGESSDGYATTIIEKRQSIDPEEIPSVLTVFKTRQQARQYLAEMARSFTLCHKFMGLEQSQGACFQYQLHKCNGACQGQEDPGLYNARFESAFRERRIATWPYSGAILIREGHDADGRGEAFLIDRWILLSSYTYAEDGLHQSNPGLNMFDFDSYKILSRFLRSPRARRHIQVLRPTEYTALLREAGEC